MAKAIKAGDSTPKDALAGFRIDIDLQDKLKAIAYWDRKTYKEVGTEAVAEYVAKYEKKNGVVKPIPAKK